MGAPHLGAELLALGVLSSSPALHLTPAFLSLRLLPACPWVSPLWPPGFDLMVAFGLVEREYASI